MNTDDGINYQIFTIISVNPRVSSEAGGFMYLKSYDIISFWGLLIMIYSHIINYDGFSQNSGMTQYFSNHTDSLDRYGLT